MEKFLEKTAGQYPLEMDLDSFVSDYDKQELSGWRNPTEKEKQEFRRVFNAVKEELNPFGIPDIQFEETMIRLFDNVPEEVVWRARLNEREGYVEIAVPRFKSREQMLVILTHEFCHFFEVIFRWKEGLKPKQGRQGLMMRVKDSLRSGNSDRHWGLIWLDEAVVGLTAEKTIKKKFPELLKEESAKREAEREFNVSFKRRFRFLPTGGPKWGPKALVRRMCEVISEKLPEELSTPEDAFKLFQKASFGQGEILPLARVLDRVYGKHALKRLAVLGRALDNFAKLRFEIPKNEAKALWGFVNGKE